MGRMSRTKGMAFECLIVRLYRERFGWRSQQCFRSAPLQAANADAAGDITTPLPVHHELGHGKQVSPKAKLEQARSACWDGHFPVAVTRRDRQSIQVTLSTGALVEMVAVCGGVEPGPPVTLSWDDWLDLVDDWWTGARA